MWMASVGPVIRCEVCWYWEVRPAHMMDWNPSLVLNAGPAAGFAGRPTADVKEQDLLLELTGMGWLATGRYS